MSEFVEKFAEIVWSEIVSGRAHNVWISQSSVVLPLLYLHMTSYVCHPEEEDLSQTSVFNPLHTEQGIEFTSPHKIVFTYTPWNIQTTHTYILDIGSFVSFFWYCNGYFSAMVWESVLKAKWRFRRESSVFMCEDYSYDCESNQVCKFEKNPVCRMWNIFR